MPVALSRIQATAASITGAVERGPVINSRFMLFITGFRRAHFRDLKGVLAAFNMKPGWFVCAAFTCTAQLPFYPASALLVS